MRLHGSGCPRVGVGIVHLGVGYADVAVETGRFAEQQVGVVVLQASVGQLDAPEPDKFHRPRAVGEECGEPLFPPGTLYILCHNLSLQLHVGHSIHQIGHTVNHAAVNVFVREMVQQIAQGEDLQLITQPLGSHGAYAFEKLDVSL